jgi:hypothetical protein
MISVLYPGIVATVERKLKCNPIARVAGQTVQAIRNRHNMAYEENARCTKSIRACEE